jgi:hypothetical protein
MTVDELWLDVFHRICGRASHEVKGALNGVSVNLEVIRSRAARQEMPASAVASFAESASAQAELLTELTDALLALARAPRDPVEVGTTLAQLAAVLEPAARSDGTLLCIERVSGPGAVRASGNVVRLVLGSALLAALERKESVHCETQLEDDALVRIRCGDGEAVQLPDEIVGAAMEAGIRVETDGDIISLAFPRAGRRAHERA